MRLTYRCMTIRCSLESNRHTAARSTAQPVNTAPCCRTQLAHISAHHNPATGGKRTQTTTHSYKHSRTHRHIYTQTDSGQHLLHFARSVTHSSSPARLASLASSDQNSHCGLLCSVLVTVTGATAASYTCTAQLHTPHTRGRRREERSAAVRCTAGCVERCTCYTGVCGVCVSVAVGRLPFFPPLSYTFTSHANTFVPALNFTITTSPCLCSLHTLSPSTRSQ